MLLFQSPSWKSEKSGKIKSKFLIFAKFDVAKIRVSAYQAIEKKEKV